MSPEMTLSALHISPYHLDKSWRENIFCTNCHLCICNCTIYYKYIDCSLQRDPAKSTSLMANLLLDINEGFAFSRFEHFLKEGFCNSTQKRKFVIVVFLISIKAHAKWKNFLYVLTEIWHQSSKWFCP